jgi:hypothetical protein
MVGAWSHLPFEMCPHNRIKPTRLTGSIFSQWRNYVHRPAFALSQGGQFRRALPLADVWAVVRQNVIAGPPS